MRLVALFQGVVSTFLNTTLHLTLLIVANNVMGIIEQMLEEIRTTNWMLL
jgi:hypothetical protein